MHIRNPVDLKEAVARGTRVSGKLYLSIYYEYMVPFDDHSRWLPGILASDLAALLNNSDGLRYLHIKNVEISGEIQSLIDAIEKLEDLEVFVARECAFHSKQMAAALSKLPKLETLEITGHKSHRDEEIPIPIFTQAILRNPLKELDLDQGNFSDVARATEFFQAVHVSTSIRKLRIGGRLSDPVVACIGEMLSHNSSLQSLQLSIRAGNISLAPLAAGLDNNTALTTLEILVGFTRRESDLECFYHSLKSKNFTLKRLKICRRMGFVDRKHDDISVFGIESEMARKINFFLALNRLGRFHLLNDANHATTSEDWFSAIAEEKDPSIIFYLAQHNPLICLPQSLGGLEPPPTEQDLIQAGVRLAAKLATLVKSNALVLESPADVQDVIKFRSPVGAVNELKMHFSDCPGHRTEQVVRACDLAALIRGQLSNLSSIVLSNVYIQGNLDAVVKEIKKNTRVVSFKAVNCIFSSSSALEEILSKLNHLEELSLTDMNPNLTLLADMITQKHSMTSLEIFGTETPSSVQEVADFFQAAQASPKLEILRCHMSTSSWSYCHFSSCHLKYVGKMLQANTSVRELELKVASGACLLPIAEGLAENRSLKSLTINFHRTTPHKPNHVAAEIHAFVEALKTNSVLTSLMITGDTCKKQYQNFWKPDFARNEEIRILLLQLDELLSRRSKLV
jgi:hypothetical protein